MVFRLDYYPNSAVGAFGKPAGAKGVCSLHMPELEEMARILGEFDSMLLITGNKEFSRIDYSGMQGFIRVYHNPIHLSLHAETPKELSNFAFELSEQLVKEGFSHYSLPFDYSQVEEVKEAKEAA